MKLLFFGEGNCDCCDTLSFKDYDAGVTCQISDCCITQLLTSFHDLPNVKAGKQKEVKNLPNQSWLMDGFLFTVPCFPPQDGDGVVIEVVGQNARPGVHDKTLKYH